MTNDKKDLSDQMIREAMPLLAEVVGREVCPITYAGFWFGSMEAANMNTEQAATALMKDVRRDLENTLKLDVIPTEDLAFFTNVFLVLLTLRRTTTVATLKASPENADKMEAIMRSDLPPEDKLREMKKLRNP